MIHSYSSISCYHEVCPRQFYERYVSKTAPFVETAETLKGKADHKALELRLLDDKPLPEHLQSCEGIVQAIDARGIPRVEKKWAVNNELFETGFWDGDAWIRGVSDVNLMAKDYSGSFIVDWKTGKNREAGKEPLQLMINAAATFAEYVECQTVIAMNVYTQTGKPGIVHTWQRSELPEIWRTVVPMVQEIEFAVVAGNFPERPSGLCGWCPVKSCTHNRS